jgi:hypothetical protein
MEVVAAPGVAEIPPEIEAGIDPAVHARQAALGQLDRNKDGLITVSATQV